MGKGGWAPPEEGMKPDEGVEGGGAGVERRAEDATWGGRRRNAEQEAERGGGKCSIRAFISQRGDPPARFSGISSVLENK